MNSDERPVSATSASDRQMLAKALFRILDQWRLSETDQLIVLGIGAEDPAVLVTMREQHDLVSDDLVERARALVRIYRYLAMLYPEHPALREKWMTSTHPRLDGESPLDRVKRGGARGIAFVTTLLEEQLF